MKILKLEEDFNLSTETFFTFFFESSGFKQRYHSTRGDSQIEVKQWVPSNDGRFSREITFFSFISNNAFINRLVGENAKVKEIQYYKFSEERILKVTSETFFEGSSIGKSFSSESEWIVSPQSGTKITGCHVAITVKNNYNGSMFKSQLENWVHETTEQSFKHWLTLVRSQVEEYQESENLKRILPTPVKQSQQPSPKLNTKPIKHQLFDNKDDSDDDDDDDDEEEENHSRDISIDDNHIAVSKQQRINIINNQQQQQHNNNEIESDNESDVSDFSSREINEEFTDDEDRDSEYISDEFYDTNEAWSTSTGTGGKHGSGQGKEIKTYINSFQNELGSMKSILEVNHNRLLSLESAFSNLRNQPFKFDQQQPHQHHTTLGSSDTSGLGVYISKLEELVKNQQDDEFKSKDKQKEYEAKIQELERKINQVNSSNSKSMLWVNVVGLLVFLIGWPILARKIWSNLLPFLLNHLKK